MARGNAFNPETGIEGDAQSRINTSQGAIPNRAGEVALEGLGQVVQGAAQTKDFGIKMGIEQDVNDVFATANLAGGLDEAAGASILKGRDEPVPADFKGPNGEFESKISDLVAAKAQGRMNDTYYFTHLSMAMKNMKAKYPGYHDIVDETFARVTGVRPANALANQLREEYTLAQTAASKSDDDRKKEIEKYSDWIVIDNPGFFDDPTKYDVNKVLAQARRRSGKHQLNQADITERNNAKDAGALTTEDAVSTFTNTSATIVETQIDQLLARALGPDKESFTGLMTQLMQGKPDAKVVAFLEQQVAAMELNTREQLNKHLLENKYTNNIPAEKRKVIIDQAMERIESYKRAIRDPEFGVALWYERNNKVQKERNESWARDNVPGYNELEVLGSVSPGLAAQWAMANPDAVDSIVPGQLLNTFSGKSTVGKAIAAIDSNSGMTPEQKSQAATQMFKQMKSTFMDPKMSDTTLRTFVEKNFGGENSDLDSVWSKLDSTSKSDFYKFWSDPALVDRIAKLNDPMITNQYVAWIKDSINEVPEFKLAVDDMSNLQEGGSFSKQFRYQWDAKSNRLVAVPTDDNLRRAGKPMTNSVLPQVGAPTSGNVILDRQLERENRRLDSLNASLTNIIGLFEKTKDQTGIDGATGLQQIFADAGAQIAIPKITGGSSTGKNPLSPLDQKAPGSTYNESGDFVSPISFNWTEQQFRDAVASGQFAPLLDVIGSAEAPKGYNQVYGKNKFLPTENMTLDEVMAFQDDMVRGGSESSAVGRYQFIRSTLKGLVNELGLPGDTPFTPELQDRLAHELVMRRGGQAFLDGKMSMEDFQNNLSKEWAGLPTTSGLSYYEGDGLNSATVGTSQVQAALEELASGGRQSVGTSQDLPEGIDWGQLGYGKIPEKERADFLKWNNNPIQNSNANLKTVRPEMQKVVQLAQKIAKVKFVVGSGIRDEEQQHLAIDLGWSKKKDSRHLHGDAADVWALDEDGQVTFDKAYYQKISEAMVQAAESLGYEIEWGGNWKNFQDLPHFEFKGEKIRVAKR